MMWFAIIWRIGVWVCVAGRGERKQCLGSCVHRVLDSRWQTAVGRSTENPLQQWGNAGWMPSCLVRTICTIHTAYQQTLMREEINQQTWCRFGVNSRGNCFKIYLNISNRSGTSVNKLFHDTFYSFKNVVFIKKRTKLEIEMMPCSSESQTKGFSKRGEKDGGWELDFGGIANVFWSFT